MITRFLEVIKKDKTMTLVPINDNPVLINYPVPFTLRSLLKLGRTLVQRELSAVSSQFAGSLIYIWLCITLSFWFKLYLGFRYFGPESAKSPSLIFSFSSF